METPAFVMIPAQTIQEQRSSISLKSKLILGLGLFLVSCSQDDRIATVTCTADPEGPVAVTTELLSNGRRTLITGYLNSWGFSLGSIVRISPGSTRSEPIVEWQTLPLLASDLLTSSTVLQSVTIGDGFEVHLDDDLRTIGRGMGVDLNDTLLRHTMLYVNDPMVRLLPDSADPLNRYPGIVERIRSAPGTRLAIVSGIVGGDWISAFNTYQSVAANTFELGRSYVHVSYTCRLIKKLQHRADTTMGVVPLIIYMTPIKYDDSTARVVLDSHPVDTLDHN